jgi:omega-amidase
MDLRITLIQTDIIWENIQENLNKYERQLETIDETDVVVYPEMFATGFSMNPTSIAQAENEIIVQWIKAQAEKFDIAIIAGFASKTDSEPVQYNNQLVWCEPSGDCSFYSKKHLFRLAGENEYYSAGNEQLVINYKGWRIHPFVCYDLRFPVWGRNVIEKDGNPDYAYDCAIYIANWPEARQLQWNTLLQARAIENQCYIVGVNRVGVDGNGYKYSGNSVAHAPKGNTLTSIEPSVEVHETVTLSKQDLDKYRSRFPFVLDADLFDIT